MSLIRHFHIFAGAAPSGLLADTMLSASTMLAADGLA